jgi:hypothetical protein
MHSYYLPSQKQGDNNSHMCGMDATFISWEVFYPYPFTRMYLIFLILTFIPSLDIDLNRLRSVQYSSFLCLIWRTTVSCSAMSLSLCL